MPGILRRAAVAVGALLAALLAGPAAHAAGGAEVTIMDDDELLGRGRAHIDDRMRTFRSLGIDRVRVSAFWKGQVFFIQNDRTKPADMDASNPNDRHYTFHHALDDVVNSATAHGLRVMISITTPAPEWATGGRGPVWRPSPREFGLYAEAVARRYASQVDHYAIMNEPNELNWLLPQRTESNAPFAPHHYRAMVHESYGRIKAADPGSVVLIGELAPGGDDRRGFNRGVRPLAFFRALGCVNTRYQAVRTGYCANFRPVPADAVGHHPYQFFGSPYRRSPNGDNMVIGDGTRLSTVLARLQSRRRIFKPNGGGPFSVFYTEFGYQTNPPDRFGIPLSRQDRYLQEAAYIAWRTPRVRSIAQFLIADSPNTFNYPRTLETGLLFADGRRKPSFNSFSDPFVIRGFRLWGQVRPGGSHVVELQHTSTFRRPFRTFRRVQTTPTGYFYVGFRRSRGHYRFLSPVGSSSVLTIR